MHDESTETNAHTDSMNSDTTETANGDEMGIALGIILTAPNVSSGDTVSLSAELLSRHALFIKKTGLGKSEQIVGGGAE